ncbi:HAMP domain-containing protein [Aquincola sp. S2]|uniref:HAMP domain-containing protein n=1 Tax=Pseudaquabacterium terrae TaxID=2732868 RepID=A0ABX2ELJ2_9BURK|nr:cache domain-containing protein [Aquabacterium terrae]NRF69522.1 HAMP domain-containing protein [Aquabacterium terrae]
MDPDATRARAPLDPDATRVRPPADPDATRVRPAGDPDATRVRPAAFDPEATRVRVATRLRDDHRDLLADSEPPPPDIPLPRQPPLALQPGFRLHEYRIERVLGQGGFGITYLATDVNLRAPLAIKEYLPEEIAFRAGDRSVSPNASKHRERYRLGLEMFLAEARTLATFRHPNIVRVARFFEAHRTAYMVLEYEKGSPLRSWWPEHQAIGERGLLQRLQPLLDGLAVVHAAGFLHRDIKPDNIQVRQDDGRFVLLDFGSAAQTVTLADQQAVIVTPGFAPIEQYGFGEQGAWTDVYALGATLYWAVTGHKPPDAEARAAGVAMKTALEAGRGRYGEAFLRAIDWALASSAGQRPRDIAAWRQALLADHASSLGLKEALHRDDGAAAGLAAPQRSLAARIVDGLRLVITPPAWPLAVKLAVAMLVTALLPMLLTAAYNLDRSRDALLTSEIGQVELLAHQTAGRLAQLINDSQNLARVLGTDADFVRWLAKPDELTKAVLRDKAIAVAQANRDVHLLMVMDRDGTAQIANDAQVMGRNFRFRQYFQEALAGRPFITGVVVGAVAGQAGVFFSMPVQEPGGQVIGAVVLRIHAASFNAILDEMRNAAATAGVASSEAALTPFLVDADGVLIYHPREDLLYRSLAPLPAERLAAIRADQRFRRDTIQSLNQPDLSAAMLAAKGPGHLRYRSAISGVDEIAGFAPVPGQGWVVGVSEPRAAFEAPVEQLYTQLLWSVALVGLLFTGLALRFARSIVRPIQALTGAAHALKAGDFDHATVTVHSRDEVGQLARTFNVMIDVLRQRERERERETAAPPAKDP